MTTLNSELPVGERPKSISEILKDPFIRDFALGRAGLLPGPPVSLATLWTKIGSPIRDEELEEWENGG